LNKKLEKVTAGGSAVKPVFGYFQGKSIINYGGINFLNDSYTLFGLKMILLAFCSFYQPFLVDSSYKTAGTRNFLKVYWCHFR